MKNRRAAERALEELFPGVQVTIQPETGEVWFKGEQGRLGMALRASRGPAGLGVRVRRFAGGAPLTLSGNLDKDAEPVRGLDLWEADLTQYGADEASQQFKRWFGASPEEREAQGLQLPERVRG